MQDDDDHTVMSKTTQAYSLASEEIECNSTDDEDDEYKNNIICISNKVMIEKSNNDRMNDKNLNLEQKQRQKQKQQWQKSNYSRKMKMKKKMRTMIMNVITEFPTSKEGVRRNKEINGTLKMIYREKADKEEEGVKSMAGSSNITLQWNLVGRLENLSQGLEWRNSYVYPIVELTICVVQL